MKNGPYILIVAPELYPGKRYRGKYCYEHHLIWWKETGMLFPKCYSIHHKNGVKTDNRFVNLELVSNNTHPVLHKKGRLLQHLICDYCHKPFTREARQIVGKLKKGQIRTFCSREHMALGYRKISAQ